MEEASLTDVKRRYLEEFIKLGEQRVALHHELNPPREPDENPLDWDKRCRRLYEQESPDQKQFRSRLDDELGKRMPIVRDIMLPLSSFYADRMQYSVESDDGLYGSAVIYARGFLGWLDKQKAELAERRRLDDLLVDEMLDHKESSEIVGASSGVTRDEVEQLARALEASESVSPVLARRAAAVLRQIAARG